MITFILLTRLENYHLDKYCATRSSHRRNVEIREFNTDAFCSVFREINAEYCLPVLYFLSAQRTQVDIFLTLVIES